MANNTDSIGEKQLLRPILEQWCQRIGKDPEQVRAQVHARQFEDEAKLRRLNAAPAETPAAAPRSSGPLPSTADKAAAAIGVLVTHPLLEGIKTKADLRRFLVELLEDELIDLVNGVIDGRNGNVSDNTEEGGAKDSSEDEWQPEGLDLSEDDEGDGQRGRAAGSPRT